MTARRSLSEPASVLPAVPLRLTAATWCVGVGPYRIRSATVPDDLLERLAVLTPDLVADDGGVAPGLVVSDGAGVPVGVAEPVDVVRAVVQRTVLLLGHGW